jgi:hypothetical protein
MQSVANCHYGDFIFSGNLFASLQFEQEGHSRFIGENGNSGGGAGFKRLRPEAGDIEAQIVIFTRL